MIQEEEFPLVREHIPSVETQKRVQQEMLISTLKFLLENEYIDIIGKDADEVKQQILSITTALG